MGQPSHHQHFLLCRLYGSCPPLNRTRRRHVWTRCSEQHPRVTILLRHPSESEIARRLQADLPCHSRRHKSGRTRRVNGESTIANLNIFPRTTCKDDLLQFVFPNDILTNPFVSPVHPSAKKRPNQLLQLSRPGSTARRHQTIPLRD